MASQEMLDQFGNSSSSTDEDGDASTSSEDMNGMAVTTSSKSSTYPPTKMDSDPMLIDDDLPAEPKPKPKIKLTLRASITSHDGSTASAAAQAGGSNGIKKEVINGTSEATEKPPQVLLVKQEPNIHSSPPAMDKPKVSPQAATKLEATETTATPPKKSKTSPSSSGKEGTSKPKKTSETKKDAKAKKEGKAKAKKEGGSNGTAKVATTLHSAGPPKKKKKKLSKLPLSMKRKLPLKGGALTSETKAESSGSATVKATVVDSNDPVEADAVAVAVVESGAAAAAPVAPKPAAKAPQAEKKRQQAKPIRLPPMTSPGLLISHLAAGTYKSAVDESGFAKPETVFEQSMAMAGYTTEARTKDPHRGSSVKRVVGDMFDSDVGFTLNFPELVPKDLWRGPSQEKIKTENNAPSTSPSRLLMNSLKKAIRNGGGQTGDDLQENGKDSTSRKRQRPWQFPEMIPVSLTIPYPESFIEKRLKYVKEVDEREKAIVAHQEKQEQLEIEREEKEFLYGKEEGATEPPKIENPVKIPPIPTPPAPPPLSEFKGLDKEQFEDNHPLYFPKGKKNFVAHLDKECFHITEGRYFGLITNTVADPGYVGPLAPGVAGQPLSVGSGLATSSTSAGTAIKSDSVLAVPLVVAAAAAAKSEATSSEKSPAKKEGSTSKPAKKAASLPAVKPGSKSKFKVKHVGPSPTANASDLRKLMDGGGEMAEKTKQCIIRAAVHASRSGKHGQGFLAPDGKAYPDVSKAFAAHAGLKPCSRCKNNKQGAYHCRLRRKHKELDHDGSNSPEVLAPLLQIPMEDLLLQPNTTSK